MRQCRLVFWFLTCLAGPLLAQNEWVLQKFLEVRGDTPFVELGHVVTGFANSSANNPFNVAVSKLMTIGCYTIDSPDDLLPQRTYWGANLVHGDFNGDGWTDLAVHREYPVLIGPAPDTVLIYLGNSAGIDTIPILKIPEDAGICSNSFGRNMAFGDLNNDEFDDLIICNQTYFKDENHLNEFGKVNIYLGRQQLRNSYDYSIIGITPYNHGLGWDCAIGDVNNDGYGDLSLIGYDTSAPSYDLHLWFSYLEIYLGSANFDIERDFYLKGADIHTQKIACFDANGDGIDDLLWSNQQRIPGRPGPD